MIKLVSPNIEEEDIQLAVEVLRSGNLVQGKYVKLLEEQISEYTHIPYSSVVSSATAALHLALMALNIGKGDTVIVSAFTFPATANVVEATGAEIILCDVELESYVVTPDSINKVIEDNKSKNIKAIIVVHEFGYPAEIQQIAEIAKKHNIYLIEDAACAFGTIANDYAPGYYSDMACYSFHPRKAITSGEGGLVLSMNKQHIEKINCLRNHGIEYANGAMDFIYAGLNYRMTDFQAALLIGQLSRFDTELAKRKKLAIQYNELLKDEKKITLPKYHKNHSWQTFMIVLNGEINRTQIIEKLAEKGVQSNLGAQALNCLTYYKTKYEFDNGSAPNASYLFKNGLAIPLYGKLDEKNIQNISDTLQSFLI